MWQRSLFVIIVQKHYYFCILKSAAVSLLLGFWFSFVACMCLCEVKFEWYTSTSTCISHKVNITLKCKVSNNTLFILVCLLKEVNFCIYKNGLDMSETWECLELIRDIHWSAWIVEWESKWRERAHKSWRRTVLIPKLNSNN